MLRQPAFWSEPNHFLSTVLTPVSWLWNWAGQMRAKITTPYVSSIKVICVGNIVVGGSGKTPTSIALANHLRTKKVCFLTRGYGGLQKTPVVIRNATDARQYGDEAVLLSRHAPTIVSANRVSALKIAEQQGFDIAIADDGFQNPSFAKTVSILVVDGARGLGNGHVIPAGPLRETPVSAAARANAILIVGEDTANVAAQFPTLPVLHGEFAVDAAIIPNKGTAYVAFAGIGHPDKFFATLRDHGYSIAETVSFADHHPYTGEDLDRLRRLAQRHDARLITTEKDHVRLPAAAALANIAQLPVTIDITGDLDGLLP